MIPKFQHNTEWNPEPCVLCFCDDGEVTCAKIPCVPTKCKAGEIIQNVPGKCCPQCIPAGSMYQKIFDEHLFLGVPTRF